MHKDFYASGFLYNLSSQQILLQQLNSSPHWLIFKGEKEDSTTPTEVFQRVIFQELHIKLQPDSILPVYDYFHKELKKTHYIVYAEISTPNLKLKPKEGQILEWFKFKQIYKLPLKEQTRQDITVGQRVIDAMARSLLPPENNLFNKS